MKIKQPSTRLGRYYPTPPSQPIPKPHPTPCDWKWHQKNGKTPGHCQRCWQLQTPKNGPTILLSKSESNCQALKATWKVNTDEAVQKAFLSFSNCTQMPTVIQRLNTTLLIIAFVPNSIRLDSAPTRMSRNVLTARLLAASFPSTEGSALVEGLDWSAFRKSSSAKTLGKTLDKLGH